MLTRTVGVFQTCVLRFLKNGVQTCEAVPINLIRACDVQYKGKVWYQGLRRMSAEFHATSLSNSLAGSRSSGTSTHMDFMG